jgi:protoporphyrinogen/coproporphyrinogen III oxidase
VLSNLLAPLLSGIYAGHASQLSLGAVFPLLAQWERQHGSLVAGAWHHLTHRNPQSVRGSTTYKRGQILGFPEGMQCLTDALHQALPADRIYLNAQVTALHQAPDATWQVSAEVAGQVQQYGARRLVLATNAGHAATLLQPLLPDAAAALAAIPYAPVTMLHMGFPRCVVGHALNGFGFLVPPDSGLPMLGCIFASSLFPNRAPAGQVLLTVLLGGCLQPKLTQAGDATLRVMMQQALYPLLDINPEVLPTLWHRIDWPEAIPQFTMGHTARWSRIQAVQSNALAIVGNYGQGVSLEKLTQSVYTPV